MAPFPALVKQDRHREVALQFCDLLSLGGDQYCVGLVLEI